MRMVLGSIQRYLNHAVAATTAFALLIVTYIMVGLRAANNIWFTMDEGSYLIKGFWFLTGQARPFIVNGPIANKPPLAFLIPGLSQLIQPGIASGRVMNVLLLAATLVGIWLIIRRRHNAWWGNLAILIALINPAWVEYYTRVMTQTPAIFLMVWSIYFSMGPRASLPRLMIGATLGTLLVLTRHNLAPFTALLFLYMVWEYDPKRAIVAFLPAAAVFVLINTAYWPEIFTNFWYRSLPNALRDPIAAFLDLPSPISLSGKNQAIEHSLIQITQELFGSARLSLAACLAALAAIPFLVKKAKHEDGKLFVFLTVNFWLLTAVHMTVIFDKNVLLYSYPAYLLFWAPTIFILLPELYALSREGAGRAGVLLAAFVVLCAGIAMHHYRALADPILNFIVPRVKGWVIQPDGVELWRVIVNKFGIEYRAQEYLVPALVGMLVGVGLVGFAVISFRRTPNTTWAAFSALFVVTLLITPTQILSGKKPTDECRSNTLGAIQNMGDQINEQVEPGSLFFWGAHSKPTVGVMLYVDQARVFPEQLNGQFYYRPDLTLEESENTIFWSDAQARIWFEQADYLVSDPGHLLYWDAMLNDMPDMKVDQLEPTDPLESCDESTRLFIYRLIH